MSYLQAKGVPYTIAEKTYELIFSLNVIDKIYDKFGSTKGFQTEFNAAIKSENPQAANGIFKWILCTLLNDAIEEQNERSKDKVALLTEHQVGRLLKAQDYFPLQRIIIEAWKESFPQSQTSDEAEDDEEFVEGADEEDLPETDEDTEKNG